VTTPDPADRPPAPSYLPELAWPAPGADGLEAPYWEATRRGELVVQRCSACRGYQWGPEWICHRCLSFELGFEPVEPVGRIYSWERSWHPVHPALAETGPYLVVLVELPGAGGVRMVGNLLGDPTQPVRIGAPVVAVFEDHAEYSLVQWRLSGADPSTPVERTN
jgi:uncharacterized OB-fold protein